MSEFLRLAVDNQLAQEAAGASPEGDRPVGAELYPLPATQRPVSGSAATTTLVKPVRSSAPSTASRGGSALQLPAITALSLGGRVQPVADDVVPALDPGARPVWGQVNRLLPLKTALRCLGLLLAQQGGGPVELRTFHRAAADAARQVGLALRHIDIAAGRRRSEWLATGFPIGEDASKSATRFTDQFTAYPRRDGEWDGALVRLGFIGVRDRGVGFTARGLEWSEIENPVLDLYDANGRALSDEESHYYIEHVQQHFPAEWTLMREIIGFVADGLRREQIDDALILSYEWTPAEAGTMRAGALGRMSDLGLIEKERAGTRITYGLSSRVADWGLLSNGGGS